MSSSSALTGAPYNEYAKLFDINSSPVQLSAITNATTIFTALLLLISFGSLAMALLGDVKKKNPVVYILNAIVASVSVGLSAVYVSNFVGVYI
ncbi:hypothetical protein Cantr_00769 [Candida viswanathii]|uniref:Dolichyl-diphosphooligosaccharide-protein glycosyltransferase subunit OST5 n=1 Tax=Candida viswanathii TaxID=5486 RepID=A0A367YGL9_9ASCO|nr:hypothetical protein Cantr_00769 [Candida viswanathii]